MASKEAVRTTAVEDYAKAIFSLESRSEEPVSTNALAERLGVTAGSVSAMLRRLDEMGLTTHVPYRGVRLTARRPQGGPGGDPPSQAAGELPRTGTRYAMGQDPRRGRGAGARDLGGPRGAIAAKLGNPTVDPHGDPIPSADLELDEPLTHRMEGLQPGDEGLFVQGVGFRPGDAALPRRPRHLARRQLLRP